MKLTARQIKFLDEIERDRRAINGTLEVALNFHGNQSNELHKREKEFWEMLGEAHGFDPAAPCGWRIASVDGSLTVVRAED